MPKLLTCVFYYSFLVLFLYILPLLLGEAIRSFTPVAETLGLLRNPIKREDIYMYTRHTVGACGLSTTPELIIFKNIRIRRGYAFRWFCNPDGSLNSVLSCAFFFSFLLKNQTKEEKTFTPSRRGFLFYFSVCLSRVQIKRPILEKNNKGQTLIAHIVFFKAAPPAAPCLCCFVVYRHTQTNSVCPRPVILYLALSPFFFILTCS